MSLNRKKEAGAKSKNTTFFSILKLSSVVKQKSFLSCISEYFHVSKINRIFHILSGYSLSNIKICYGQPYIQPISISIIFEFKYSENLFSTFFAPQDYKIRQELSVRKKYKIKQLHNGLIACS